MTAEISVMNKIAVAMAADSAVTVVGKKVYNTGSKLFPVTHSMPIGVMFYGNSQFMGVPWEVIIASFRKKLSSRKFSTVKECGEDFLDFLRVSEDLFPEDIQKQYFLNFLNELLNHYLNEINLTIKKQLDKRQLTSSEISDIIDNCLEPEIKKWNDAAFLSGVTENARSGLLQHFSTDFETHISNVFKDLPIKNTLRDSMKLMFANFALKTLLFNAFKSGVVFCGFGEQERYPSIFSVELDLIVRKRVKHASPNILSISDSMPASIHPFAQQDVVTSFLKGIDPTFLKFVDGYVRTFFLELHQKVDLEASAIGQPAENLRAIFSRMKNEAASAVLGKFEEMSQNQFVNPVITAAQILSKDDLAQMAETLVSLTSFRRKISLDLETVGGPVDVAVISKKDGFIWIKRKHYFEPELNPHFFWRRDGKRA